MLLVRPELLGGQLLLLLLLRGSFIVLSGLKCSSTIVEPVHARRRRSQLREQLGRHFSSLVAALVVDAATALVTLHLWHTLGQRATGTGNARVRAIANVAATQRLCHNAQRVPIDIDLKGGEGCQRDKESGTG